MVLWTSGFLELIEDSSGYNGVPFVAMVTYTASGAINYQSGQVCKLQGRFSPQPT